MLLIGGDVILPVLGGIDLICWLLFFITVVDSGRGSFSLFGSGILRHLVSWGLSGLLFGWGLSGLLLVWGLSGLVLGFLSIFGDRVGWVFRGLLSLVLSVLGDFIDWGLGRRVFGGFLLIIDGSLSSLVL